MSIDPKTSVMMNGNFKLHNLNKGLDRPRSESNRELSPCISIGVGGEGGKGMQFGTSAMRPSDLWGRR